MSCEKKTKFVTVNIYFITLFIFQQGGTPEKREQNSWSVQRNGVGEVKKINDFLPNKRKNIIL